MFFAQDVDALGPRDSLDQVARSLLSRAITLSYAQKWPRAFSDVRICGHRRAWTHTCAYWSRNLLEVSGKEGEYPNQPSLLWHVLASAFYTIDVPDGRRSQSLKPEAT